MTCVYFKFISLASDRFGSENTAILAGLMIFWCKLWIVALTTFQATIYEQYNSWQFPFILITIILFVISVFVLFFVIYAQRKEIIVFNQKELSMEKLSSLVT